MIERETLRKKIYSKIDSLPVLPIVIPRVLNLLENRDACTAEIVDTISHDPSLTSKILQVANSAYYGFPQKITSLEQAVPLLGFNMVKSLVLSIGVVKSHSPSNGSPFFSHKNLWVHSLAVATVMRTLGKQVLDQQEDPEYLFIIGLLHDIGKIVLDSFFPVEFNKALQLEEENRFLPLFLAEQQAIGIDHGEIGALLLSRWRFPPNLVSPILSHHLDVPIEGTNLMDLAILRIANGVVKETGVGNGGNLGPASVPMDALDYLNLDGKVLVALKTFLKNEEEGILAFYQVMG
jgi:putative nucleotidyltransferase with HDIG domain